MKNMKKIFCLIAVVCCLALAGCSGSESAEEQVFVPTPELAPGDAGVVITDELRQQYFELAQAMRWDFLPNFEAGSAPTKVEDYLYLVYAQQLEWEDYYTLKNDGDMSISAEYVSDYVRRHFGVEVEHPQAGENVGHFSFDGEKYTLAPQSWKELPFFQLESVGVSKENGKTIYCVEMREYLPDENWDGESNCVGDNMTPRDWVLSGKAEQSGMQKGNLKVVWYSVDAETGDLVFEAVR